ncbi:MAG: hypothetical protein CL608_26140 [Anaerolineaceae bacterium]|nr:hypothetical protein [Anaerolineaceae bacterium]
MNNEPITIITIDDHPLIREAVRSSLASRNDMKLVGEGWVGEHLLTLVEQHQPDVVILDLGMPQFVDGQRQERFAALPTLVTLNESFPKTAVIILSQYAMKSVIQEAIEVGVKGYLLKSDNLSLNLTGAIEAVHHGGVYFSQEISQLLFQQATPVAGDNLLTGRQKEIILAIARNPNASYTQIANDLHISESTLKGHLHNAFRALDVTNITACIIHCMQQGLIPFAINEHGQIEFGALESEV